LPCSTAVRSACAIGDAGLTVQGGLDAEPRLVARAQDLHLDAFEAAERTEQALAVRRIPHGRRGHGAQRVLDRRSGQPAGRAAASRVGTRSSTSTR
jgi:hypothetical protein